MFRRSPLELADTGQGSAGPCRVIGARERRRVFLPEGEGVGVTTDRARDAGHGISSQGRRCHFRHAASSYLMSGRTLRGHSSPHLMWGMPNEYRNKCAQVPQVSPLGPLPDRAAWPGVGVECCIGSSRSICSAGRIDAITAAGRSSPPGSGGWWISPSRSRLQWRRRPSDTSGAPGRARRYACQERTVAAPAARCSA